MRNLPLQESKTLLALGLPLIISGLVEAMPSFVNNVMLAHLGVQQLAAGALVSSAFVTIMLIFYGTLSATSALISHHYGAQEKFAIAEIFRDAQLIAIVVSIPIMSLLWHGDSILQWLGQKPELVQLARGYLHGLTWAVLPDFTGMILWQFFIGLGRPRITLIASLMYVPINILANYCLIFGKLGFPALGMSGIGYGTAIAYWIILFYMIGYILYHREFRNYFNMHLLRLKQLHFKRLFILGMPVGVMWSVELCFFTIAAFYAGKINTDTLAAQQIGVQALMFAFMVVSGLSQAITVRVGHLHGAKQHHAVKNVYWASLFICFSYTFILNIIFWFFPKWIIQIDFNLFDPNNAALIAIAIQLLVILGFFQLFDNIRYMTFAMLRGLKDTRFSALCSIIAFLIAAPLFGYFWVIQNNGSMLAFWTFSTIASAIAFFAMHRRLMRLLPN